MIKRKYNELTLEKKMEVIRSIDSGKSLRLTAREFDVSKTTVKNIVANRAKIEEVQVENSSSKRKRISFTHHNELNQKVYEFFRLCKSQSVPVSGVMLQEKARIIAASMGIENFSASNGWLTSFRSRHNVHFKPGTGESVCGSPLLEEEWNQTLSQVSFQYDPENVFNAVEVGIFYKELPTRLLVEKQVKDDRTVNERLTVLLCASSTGERLKPVVIGSSEPPRCFKAAKIKEENVPVIWKSNKNSSMTSCIFEEWLLKLNSSMMEQNRKILLLVDSAPSHQPLELSNVEMLFLPPNLKSELQPLHFGVIQAFKLNYRKHLVNTIMSQIDSCPSIEEFTQSISIFDAMLWIGDAWKNVERKTIADSFKRKGVLPLVEKEVEETESNSHPEDCICQQLGIELVDSNTVHNFENDNIQLHESSSDGDVETILHKVINGKGEEELDCNQKGGDEDDEFKFHPVISHETAKKYIDLLTVYASNHSPAFFNKMLEVQIEMNNLRMKSKVLKRMSGDEYRFLESAVLCETVLCEPQNDLIKGG